MGNQPSSLGHDKRFSRSRRDLRSSPSEPVLRRFPQSCDNLLHVPTAQDTERGQFTRTNRRETNFRPLELEAQPVTYTSSTNHQRRRSKQKSLVIDTSNPKMRLTMSSEPMLANYPEPVKTEQPARSVSRSLRRSASILSNSSLAAIVRKSSFIRKRASRQSLEVKPEDIPPVPTPVSALAPPPAHLFATDRPYTPDFEVPVLGMYRRGTLHIVNGTASPAPSEMTVDKTRVSHDDYFTIDESASRGNASPMRAVKHMKEVQRRTSTIQQNRREKRRTFELDSVETATHRANAPVKTALLPAPSLLGPGRQSSEEKRVTQIYHEKEVIMAVKKPLPPLPKHQEQLQRQARPQLSPTLSYQGRQQHQPQQQPPQRPPLRSYVYGSREHAFQVLDGGSSGSSILDKSWERPATGSTEAKGPVHSLKKADSFRTVDSSSTEWAGSDNLSAGSSFTSYETLSQSYSPVKEEYPFNKQALADSCELPVREVKAKSSRGKLRKPRPASHFVESRSDPALGVQQYRDTARLHITPSASSLPSVPAHIAAQLAQRPQNFSRPQSATDLHHPPKPMRVGHDQRDAHAPRPPPHRTYPNPRDLDMQFVDEQTRGRPPSVSHTRGYRRQESYEQSRSRSRPKTLHNLPLDAYSDFVVAPPVPQAPRHQSMIASTPQHARPKTGGSLPRHSLQNLPFSRSQPLLTLSAASVSTSSLSAIGNYALAYEAQQEAERLRREAQQARLSHGAALGLGRYQGGFGYGYEPGKGVGGSAGLRGHMSMINLPRMSTGSGVGSMAHASQHGPSRKSVGLSEQWGVDLSDVPVFLRAQ